MKVVWVERYRMNYFHRKSFYWNGKNNVDFMWSCSCGEFPFFNLNSVCPEIFTSRSSQQQFILFNQHLFLSREIFHMEEENLQLLHLRFYSWTNRRFCLNNFHRNQIITPLCNFRFLCSPFWHNPPRYSRNLWTIKRLPLRTWYIYIIYVYIWIYNFDIDEIISLLFMEMCGEGWNESMSHSPRTCKVNDRMISVDDESPNMQMRMLQ